MKMLKLLSQSNEVCVLVVQLGETRIMTSKPQIWSLACLEKKKI